MDFGPHYVISTILLMLEMPISDKYLLCGHNLLLELCLFSNYCLVMLVVSDLCAQIVMESCVQIRSVFIVLLWEWIYCICDLIWFESINSNWFDFKTIAFWFTTLFAKISHFKYSCLLSIKILKLCQPAIYSLDILGSQLLKG